MYAPKPEPPAAKEEIGLSNTTGLYKYFFVKSSYLSLAGWKNP